MIFLFNSGALSAPEGTQNDEMDGRAVLPDLQSSLFQYRAFKMYTLV